MKHIQQSHQNNHKLLAFIKPSLLWAWLFLISRKPLHKLGVVSLAALMIVSFIVGSAGNASAAVNYSGLTVPEKASVYESGLILERCLVDLWVEVNEPYIKQGRVGQSPSAADKWTVWDKPIINYHQTLKSDDNVMDCSEYDNALIKGAINRLKIDPIHFVCEMGGKRANGTSDANCTKGTGNFSYQFPDGKITRDKLVKYLKDQVGLNLDSPGNEVRYWRSYNIVSNYCVGASISKAEWDKEGGNSRYNYTDPKTGKEVYFLANSLKNERPKYKDVQQGDVNCRTYWERLNQYYPDYARYMLNLGDEERDKEEAAQEDNQSPPSSTEGQPSCTIDGIGWIICPVITFMNGIVDASYGFVASLLQSPPLMTTGENTQAYEAWKIMRTIANVAFVIAFLIIIFSQLSGVGVSNYGVKKLLPRLIVSAILVNISFFVCAIAVDISNIAGASMRDLFSNISSNIQLGDGITINDPSNGTNMFANIWGTLIAAGAAGGIAYWVGLSAFIPALLAAGLAIVTVFLVLVFRQALIILLVVISPLAFVAFLLPNTEDLFTKWRKLLTTLLLMFPIIGALYGISALASEIVMNSADGDYTVAVQVMGACIAILPLALTPMVMKTAGGVLNRFAGFVNNPNRGPVDRLKKAGASYANTRRNIRNTRALGGENQLGRGAFVRWRARRNTIGNMAESESKRANTEYIADQLQNDGKFAQAAAGGRAANAESIMRVTASAISSADKLDSEEVSATNVVLKNAELSQAQIRTLALGGSVTTESGKTFDASKSLATQRAAMQQMVASNDVEGMNQAWNSSAVRNSSELRSTFADALQSSSARPGYFSQGAIAGLRQAPNSESTKVAPLNVDTAIENAIKAGAYSPEKIATADKDDLAQIVRVLKTSQNLTDDQKQAIMINAETALSDSKLSAVIGKNKEQVIKIRDFDPNEGGTLNVREETVATDTSSEPPTVPLDRQ